MFNRFGIVSVFVMAVLGLCSATGLAQDLTPAKPPGSAEPAPAQAPAQAPEMDQPPSDAPRRPNARPQGEGQRRRNADPAAIPVPEDIQLVRDVVFATTEDTDGKRLELMMDCAFPKQFDAQALPVVMFIHGGGWSGGNRATGLPFVIALARGGYFACTVSYRLSGQAPFPAQLHDVKAAVRFVRAHADELAIDPQRIAVMGISAGGHLSALLGVTANENNADLEGDVGEVDHVSASVAAVVDISGPHDLILASRGGDGGIMIRNLLGGPVNEKTELAKAASPVTHVNAGDAAFLIVQGGRDRLVPDEQAEVMRDALNNAGVECQYLHVPEAGHGVADRQAYIAIAEFLDARLGGNAGDAFGQIARRFPTAVGGAAGGTGGAGGAGGAGGTGGDRDGNGSATPSRRRAAQPNRPAQQPD